MKIRSGDKVKILSGKDKGKTGKVLKVFKEKSKVLVEGVNIVKKHVKPQGGDNKGGIVSLEKPIHVSNVMFFDAKAGKTTRLGYQIVKGKKYRVSKKTGDVVDKK